MEDKRQTACVYERKQFLIFLMIWFLMRGKPFEQDVCHPSEIRKDASFFLAQYSLLILNVTNGSTDNSNILKTWLHISRFYSQTRHP